MASLKITYGFKGGALGLRSIDASSHSPPGSDPITPGAGGVWITVHDSKGEQIHAQILNDPRAGSGPNAPIPDKTFVAVTPNPGDNGFIAFHMNFGQPKVAVFPLKTSRLFRDFLAKLLRLLNRKKQRVWLLILSDGFTEAERPRFHAFADRFVDTLCESPPFKEYPQLRDAIAVRDGPTRPGGEFGWTIQGLEGRLLAQVDLALANKFIAKLGIDPINILAVINDNRYGGSGGDPAVTTVGDPANLDL